MRKSKKLVIISDTHSGHAVGLTPPEFQGFDRYEPARREYWNWFAKEIKALGPIDYLVHNGDACDGKGKTGGDEHIAASILDQCVIAAEVINFVKARKVYMVIGTAFHVEAGGIEVERWIGEKV